MRLTVGTAITPERTPFGTTFVRFWSIRIANWGAWAALANVFSAPPMLIGSGSTRWNVSPGSSVVGQVGDVVHGLGDEVHRDDVRLAALGAGERDPRRQRVAQLLEQLEQVVGAVDLVHLAGLRVADDDPRAEDERLRLHALAHHLLRLVLGAVVVVGQLLLLVEHVLLEHALVGAGDGDRAGVVEAADVVGVGELDHVPRAVDVRPDRGLLFRLDVVDGGQVEQVVDLLVEGVDPQTRCGQVSGHRARCGPPARRGGRSDRRPCRASPHGRARRSCPRASAAPRRGAGR